MLVFLSALASVASADFSSLHATFVPIESTDGHAFTFSLTNPTAETVRVPIHLTPFNGIVSDIFEIEGATYTGMLAKRSHDELLAVAAGQTITHTFDLSMDYSLPAAGIYTIRWRYGTSVPQQFKAAQVFGDRRFGTQVAEFKQPNEFVACSATEQREIITADGIATRDANISVTCLNAHSCNTVFTTWFGTIDTTRYNKIQKDFVNIKGKFDAGSYRVACHDRNCGANVYAFVYPTDRLHTIYVCDVFWRIPAERAETLTHEMSHFVDVGTTQDIAYGQPACKQLARESPNRAVQNADSLCFFSKMYP